MDCCDFDRCNQRRTSPVRASRLRVKNGGEQVDSGLPVVMFDKPYQWLRDLLFSAIWWCGTFVLIAIVFAALGFAAGLYRIF